MAAVLTPTEEEWAVIEKFLGQIRQNSTSGQGAIVVTPDAQRKMAEFGMAKGLEHLSDYDFGGEADYKVDVTDFRHAEAEWLEGIDRAGFEKSLENCDLDIKLEAVALAYGFRPSWYRG